MGPISRGNLSSHWTFVRPMNSDVQNHRCHQKNKHIHGQIRINNGCTMAHIHHWIIAYSWPIHPIQLIWANYYNSLTWIKAIWGWFPYDFQWARSELVIIYPELMAPWLSPSYQHWIGTWAILAFASRTLASCDWPTGGMQVHAGHVSHDRSEKRDVGQHLKLDPMTKVLAKKK